MPETSSHDAPLDALFNRLGMAVTALSESLGVERAASVKAAAQ